MLGVIPAVSDGLSFEAAARILEIVSFLGAAGVILLKMGAMTGEFRQIGVQQATEISELKKGVESIGAILIRLTEQSGRMDRIEDRQMASGKRLDDLTARFNRYSDRVFSGSAGES